MADTTKPDFQLGDKVWLNGAKGVPDEGYVWRNLYVTAGPYMVEDVWMMTLGDKSDDSYSNEVECKRFHLVFRPTKPKGIKDYLKEIKVKKSAIVTAVVLGVMAIMGLWLAGNYNSLVSAKNAVDNSKAKIDTQLTRRYELIDNIVQSVQGSQAQESDVFGKIAEARKVGGQAGASPEQQAEANQTIDTQIALLPRLQEAYPELRSNDQVSKLITELQGTANGIRDARDNYNNTVTNYNTNITSFPKNIFAGIFNFDKAKLFEASAQEKVNPKVELDREKN